MKNIHIIFVLVLLISTMSCKKNGKDQSTSETDKADGRISVVTNNLQTKYGAFVTSATVQGTFKPITDINSFAVGDYNVKKQKTEMYLGATSMDSTLKDIFPSLYGKALRIKLNGKEITNNHLLPYANVVKVDGSLINWTISKSEGLTIKWTKHGYLHNASALSSIITTRINTSLDPIVLPPDNYVDGERTVVAIIPDNLSSTTGTSQYWVMAEGATSFTFDSNVLSMYSPYETLTLSVTTGASLVVDQNNTVIDILYLNSTILASVEVLP